MVEYLKRTQHRGETGFWLPVGGSPFEDENDGIGAEGTRVLRAPFAVWMEYDADHERFLGSVSLGFKPCHVEAYRVAEDEEGLYHVAADEETDAFVAAKVDGNWPCETFAVAGFEGAWICVIDPFT